VQQAVRVNFVGNYFKPGTDTTVPPAQSYEMQLRGGNFPSVSSAYLKGNMSPNRPTDNQPELDLALVGDLPTVASRHNFPLVIAASAFQAYEDVLTNAGARLPCLDAVDRRVLNDVRNGTGRIVNTPSEVGGWPDLTQPCGSGISVGFRSSESISLAKVLFRLPQWATPSLAAALLSPSHQHVDLGSQAKPPRLPVLLSSLTPWIAPMKFSVSHGPILRTQFWEPASSTLIPHRK
jgi:hypothetical protein